jgi:uncharacterized protein (DUF1330 family)
MSAYIIWQVQVHDREAMDRYAELAWPTLDGRRAEAVVADDAPQVLEGTWPGTRTFALRFEDRAAALAWYHGADYQAVIGLRQAAAVSNVVLVDGLD